MTTTPVRFDDLHKLISKYMAIGDYEMALRVLDLLKDILIKEMKKEIPQ